MLLQFSSTCTDGLFRPASGAAGTSAGLPAATARYAWTRPKRHPAAQEQPSCRYISTRCVRAIRVW